jgi:signal transduction histidine kinase
MEYYRLIGQECRRLGGLVENVLDFSRIDLGRKRYEFDPTDIVALVRHTVAVMTPYATDRGVTLRLELPTPGAQPEASAQPLLDGRAVQQALVNLIDNAIKHSPPNATVTVSLILPRDGQPLRLAIRDHGPGIAAQDQERIFEPFCRLESELRRQTTGVGIGLSIVQHVAEAHGGRVLVESKLGAGSCFVLEIPCHAS